MENEIIIGLIGLGTTITSGWVSWFFARKKYNSEVDNQVIINMQKALEFYQHLSDDNTDRLAKVLAQNKEILEQNAQLLEQNTRLEDKVKDLEEKIQILNKRLTPKTSSRIRRNEIKSTKKV